MTWCRDARLFANDPKGDCFLKGPVDQICHVNFNELRYSERVPHEVYSTSFPDSHPSLPLQHTCRAADDWKACLKTTEQERRGQLPHGHIPSTRIQQESGRRAKGRVVAPTNVAIALFVVFVCTLFPLAQSKTSFT
jgi:hypothetical protein